ncbi:hypothetical protein E4T38_03074 [Aureobasidium subglaciale]|nr:hypothetical protein E4T38_03074 [Aureobasidium subglaciale]KAI5226843.1 hypothetical protein E4T40_02848 [Aureobasidium subglaciale]KAI5230065.1 hypothetical protein E4T41_03071 [Aureobasidium subglaciale]KAI5264676.1 hypothetical protein E4T46_02849 [Aureobasidium subglaciale]
MNDNCARRWMTDPLLGGDVRGFIRVPRLIFLEDQKKAFDTSAPRGQGDNQRSRIIVSCKSKPLPLAGFNLISTKDGERVLAPTPETRTWRSEESTWRTRSTKTSCDEPLTRAVNKHEIQYQVESVAMRLRSSMIFLSLDELFDE